MSLAEPTRTGRGTRPLAMRRPGILDTYLMGEVLPMFAGGMAVVVLLLILGLLMDQAAPIIAKGVNALLVGKYLAFRLPEAFSRGMPIALLFAVLLALSRLTQDSELKAAVLHG
ncbi:MAG TPA: LptF/LptG family permease, partial [Deinococcales bacterium]|nr:LptF/LptG family permease [Deinococcales bacterium]